MAETKERKRATPAAAQAAAQAAVKTVEAPPAAPVAGAPPAIQTRYAEHTATAVRVWLVVEQEPHPSKWYAGRPERIPAGMSPSHDLSPAAGASLAGAKVAAVLVEASGDGTARFHTGAKRVYLYDEDGSAWESAKAGDARGYAIEGAVVDARRHA